MAHWTLSIQASIRSQAINPVNHHNLERIDALLRQARVVCAGRVAWFEEIDSTNSWLMKQRQIDGENHGDTHRDIHGRGCLAELQTAGRGRRGRVWRASRSSSVLLSLGWHLGAVACAGLSLVSGLAIIDGLRRTGIDGVGLKWPNDVMSGGKKLGGVLTELSGEHCVVGMGINVAMPSDNDADNNAPDAPDAADETADEAADENAPRTDLKSLGHDIDRDALAANLIIAHCHYLQHFCRGGFAQFVTEWNELNVHQGRAVSVCSSAASGSASSRSCDGIVRGVDRDGALLIDHNGTRRRLISAQVRIRPLDERMRESCANES